MTELPPRSPELPSVQLEELRALIDEIDTALCELLAARFGLTQQVGQYKADRGIPAVDPEREQRQFAKIMELAQQFGLDPDFAASFLRLIIDQVVVNHKTLAEQVSSSQSSTSCL